MCELNLQHHLYVDGNMGFVAHNVVKNQRALKRKTGESARKSKPKVPRKLVQVPENIADPDDPDPIEFTQNVSCFACYWKFIDAILDGTSFSENHKHFTGY